MNVGHYQKLSMRLASGRVVFYVGQKVIAAKRDLLEAPSIKKRTTKLRQLNEFATAIYEQGLKDGRKEIIEEFDKIRASVRYQPPGRPKGGKRH